MKNRALRHLVLGLTFLAGGVVSPPVRGEALKLDADTIWAGEVQVENVAVVGPEATLVVRPGSRIRFAAGAALVVYGRLEAVGTAGDPVVFTTRDRSAAPGVWQGIWFEEGQEQPSLLRHSRVEGAAVGVGGERSKVRLEKVELCGNRIGYRARRDFMGSLLRCTVRGNETGIMLTAAGATRIEGCRITGNRRWGVVCRSCAPLLRGNTVAENGAGGIWCRNEAAARIEGNAIRSNPVGLRVEMQVAPVIRHNEIAGNDVGLWCEKLAFPQVIGNVIQANRLGVYCNLSGYPRLRGNNIAANREYALDLGPSQSLEVSRRRPRLARSGGGPGAVQAGPKGTEKNRPRPFAPEFPADGRIDARGNWWGEEGTAELAAEGLANPSFVEDGADAPSTEFEGKIVARDRFALEDWVEEPVAGAGPAGLGTRTASGR